MKPERVCYTRCLHVEAIEIVPEHVAVRPSRYVPEIYHINVVFGLTATHFSVPAPLGVVDVLELSSSTDTLSESDSAVADSDVVVEAAGVSLVLSASAVVCVLTVVMASF